MSKLVNIFQLAEITGLSVRQWRTLVAKRAVPFLKVGYRTLLFEPEKVLKALERFEIKGA